jgi:hypothetical protein
MTLTMKPTAIRNVWLCNPANLVVLNTNDGNDIHYHANYVDMDIDMSNCGWAKLGSATITFDLTADKGEAAKAAAKAISVKIEKIEATAAAEVSALREGLRRLQAITYEG